MNFGNQKENKHEDLPFISTFNPNNPPIYNAIKNSVEVLKRDNNPEFESIKLINSKRQPPNLKKLLTKAEISNVKVDVESSKIRDANVASHCYYPKNIPLKI